MKMLQKSGRYVIRIAIIDAADLGPPQYRVRLFVVGLLQSEVLKFPIPLLSMPTALDSV